MCRTSCSDESNVVKAVRSGNEWNDLKNNKNDRGTQLMYLRPVLHVSHDLSTVVRHVGAGEVRNMVDWPRITTSSQVSSAVSR